MQETGGFDWSHGITGLISGAFGAASGFVAAIWRVARIEPSIRADFSQAISASEQRVEDKMDLETKAFGETLRGLREKINDVELYTERHFLSNDFLTEYREDMREVKAMIKNGHK